MDDVKFVINYDFPSNAEDYIHRIGRTGRSNNKGTSYTLFTPANAGKVDELINILNETNQYINPELYQLKKYNPKGMNNRRGGGNMNRKPFGQGGGFKKNSYGQGNKTGGGYGRSNYDNSGGFKKNYESNGYSNGAGNSKYGERKMNSHTRFDDRSATTSTAYSNGSRFQ